MRPNEDTVGADDPEVMARGTTLRNATNPASEQCQHGDNGKPISNEAEGKLFRPERD